MKYCNLGGVHLGIFGEIEPASSPNPDLISEQTTAIFHIRF